MARTGSGSRDGGALETWPLERLRPYERNPQMHSPEQVAGIARSIEAYGFRDPIGVLPDGTIVEGHGRLEALRQLGRADVPVLVLHNMTDEEARAYRIAHNEHQRRATRDDEAMAEELVALADLGASFAGIGLDDDDLARLIGTDGVGAIDPADAFGALSQGEPDAVQVAFVFTPEEREAVMAAVSAERRPGEKTGAALARVVARASA